MVNRKKPLREQVAEEVNFSDRCFRGEHHIASRLERWAVSLYPAMPNTVDRLLPTLGRISGMHICEIGCGSGWLTRELATRGAHVSALDMSGEAVTLAQERNRDLIPEQVEVRRMDASNLTYDDESFDLVTGVSILHHVDIDKTAKEISRVLKPGGRACFIEPLALIQFPIFGES